MRIHGIIQARMASSRLPGKTLMDLEGQLLLFRVINLAKKSKKINLIIVATTTNKKDDLIVNFCKKNEIKYFRGSETNVLDRYVRASKKFKSDVIVRITGDNPFVDPGIFDQLINKHTEENNDYTLSTGFPIGISCEVFSRKSLEIADREATEPYHREHLGTFFLDNPQKFKIGVLKAPKKYSNPEIRLTIDTEEDLKTARNIIATLGKDFDLRRIIKLYKDKPTIFVNREIKQFYPTQNIKRVFKSEG